METFEELEVEGGGAPGIGAITLEEIARAAHMAILSSWEL